VIPAYEPMLATQWRTPFSADDWFFEPKWDGYRLIATGGGHTTTLRSRAGTDLTSRYPELSGARFDRPVVLDGEVVAFGDDGNPSFERLQQRSGRSAAPTGPRVTLVVFDLLHAGDESLVSLPLSERRGLLEAAALPDDYLVGAGVIGAGLDLWETVMSQDLEGMVAKRLSSRYLPGVRSPEWRKIHHVNTTRVVIGGYTPGHGGRASTFGGLLVGQWDGPNLRFCGSVGSGFSHSDLTAIRGALDQQTQPSSPFADETPPDAVFVEPVLVAVVGYRNWTGAGRLRHPRFMGFTHDPPDAFRR
jgi:bifunctional non-homologous end joining protein LigD